MKQFPNTICLDDHSALAEAIRRRPTRLAHGTVVILALLIAAAIVWLAFSRANLVVVAQGVVRPLTKTYPVVSGEMFGASTGARVAAVHYTQGQRVGRGDLLLAFDTTWLDHEISMRTRQIVSTQSEVHHLEQLQERSAAQFAARGTETQARMSQLRGELRRARARRSNEIEMAAVELSMATQSHARLTRLADTGTVPEAELRDAKAKLKIAAAKLRSAELPLDEAEVSVLEKRKELITREYEVNRAELASQKLAKKEELERAKMELAALQAEREQAWVTSPIDGIVTTVEPSVGGVLPPGGTVAEIAPEGELRLDVSIQADDVGLVRVGMPVRVKVNAFDYQDYGSLGGRVSFLAPDAEVVPAAADDPVGRPIFVARVRLDSDRVGRNSRIGHLKIGMVGLAEIQTDQQPLLSLLFKRIDRAVRLH